MPYHVVIDWLCNLTQSGVNMWYTSQCGRAGCCKHVAQCHQTGSARTSPQMPTSCPGGMATRSACSVGPLRGRCMLRRDPVELAMLLREAAGSLRHDTACVSSETHYTLSARRTALFCYTMSQSVSSTS